MRRRTFIAGIGGAAAWPVVARAQQRGTPIIGLLSGVAIEAEFYSAAVASIRRGLNDVGFIEGRNLIMDYRTADGHPERLPGLAAALVQRPVTVIIAIGGAAPALAAKAATSTIPIVFANGGDAEELGLVKSFNRPEANVTGMSFATSQLAPKRLELLCEVVPKAELVASLDNSRLSASFKAAVESLTTAAHTLGRQLVTFDAGTEQEIDAAFTDMVQQRVSALVVSTDALIVTRSEQIVALATRHGLPTVFPLRTSVVLGGLMSYNAVIDDMYRQAGVYAGRILKGEKPADLPVLLPAKFEFVLNLRTARALGIKISDNVLSLANEVIE